MRTDPHPPNPFRVDGTVSNMPEFAEAFKCSKRAKVRISYFSSLEADVDVVLAQSSEGATVHILVKSRHVEGPAFFFRDPCILSLLPSKYHIIFLQRSHVLRTHVLCV